MGAWCSIHWQVREVLVKQNCFSIKGEQHSQINGCRFAQSVVLFFLSKNCKALVLCWVLVFLFFWFWFFLMRNNWVVEETMQLKRCTLLCLKVIESDGFKLKIHTHKRLHFEYLRPFFARAYLYFHLSVHKSLAKTYKRYFVQWHQREKIFLENFMLLNLHRFTVLSSQINAKPQCKHLDFENFGGVSFPNSNYWFYIIFSQGSWSQPHMSLE